MLLTIECNERSALWHCLYNNLLAKNHIGIKAMKGLTVCHHNVICNINNIIDRAETDNAKFIL